MPQPPRHRDAIVRTAVRLFRQQGYAATGLNQLVAESGAPKGSLYHYFPDGKASIAAAAVSAAGERVTHTLRELAAQGLSPGDRLRRYGALLAGWMSASGFRDGCPIATTLLETAPQAEAVRAAGERALGAWHDAFAGQLVEQNVAPDRAKRMASLAVAAIEGALLQARVQRSGVPIVDAAEEVAAVFDGAVAHAALSRAAQTVDRLTG
jgi:TetR/AcrR family transcriptional repressor of lmrAB and yxaGH operons